MASFNFHSLLQQFKCLHAALSQMDFFLYLHLHAAPAQHMNRAQANLMRRSHTHTGFSHQEPCSTFAMAASTTILSTIRAHVRPTSFSLSQLGAFLYLRLRACLLLLGNSPTSSLVDDARHQNWRPSLFLCVRMLRTLAHIAFFSSYKLIGCTCNLTCNVF